MIFVADEMAEKRGDRRREERRDSHSWKESDWSCEKEKITYDDGWRGFVLLRAFCSSNGGAGVVRVV